VTASATLRFRKVGKLPELEHRRARAATLDLVASLSGGPAGIIVMTVTRVADGTSTTVTLPEALRVESYGAFQLRIDHGDVEVVAIGSTFHPGGLARWSSDGHWSTPITLSAEARKELPSDVAIARVADRWLVVARTALDSYPIWTIDGSGTHRISPSIAAGAYAWATQQFGGAVGFDGGSVFLIDDGSTADGKAAGYPGRTRAVLVAKGRFDELAAPFPWKTMRAPTRIADGAIAAISYQLGDAPARLLLVDAKGILSDLVVPDGLPRSLRWMDGVLVGWGASHDLPGTSSDGAQPLTVADMSGWILDKRRTLHSFAPPRETPPGWMPGTRARIGNELCAWGGVSMPFDDAAHHTLDELYAARRTVDGAACIDPRAATVRLLAAQPPAEACAPLADGPEALIVCHEPEGSTLWLVTADP
jgi:hypothetical protein